MFVKISLAIILVIAATAGYLWSNQTEIVENFNEQRSLEREQSEQAGRLFGETNDQNACLTRTLADFDGCQTFGCSVSSGLFLKNCLAVATPNAALCEGVPVFRDEPTEDDKSWAKYECIERNVRGEACRMLLRQVSQFCSQ
jgi:hypothetical protein